MYVCMYVCVYVSLFLCRCKYLCLLRAKYQKKLKMKIKDYKTANLRHKISKTFNLFFYWYHKLIASVLIVSSLSSFSL